MTNYSFKHIQFNNLWSILTTLPTSRRVYLCLVHVTSILQRVSFHIRKQLIFRRFKINNLQALTQDFVMYILSSLLSRKHDPIRFMNCIIQYKRCGFQYKGIFFLNNTIFISRSNVDRIEWFFFLSITVRLGLYSYGYA